MPEKELWNPFGTGEVLPLTSVAQKLRMRKNLVAFEMELVMVFSEPTATTAFVSSAQVAGERVFSDCKT